MPQISLRCNNCGRVFPSGINLGAGATAILKGNVSKCPFCGSWENIPDGTFKATVEGVLQFFEQSENPLELALELEGAFKTAKSSEDLSKIKRSPKFSAIHKLLPDTTDKIAIYLTILSIIIQLYTSHTSKPNVKVNYNTFINVYYQIIDIKLGKR